MNTMMLWVTLGWLMWAPAGDLAPAQVEKWVSYTSQEGKVKMKFPGEYEVSEEQKETHKVVKISSTIGDENYFLSYTVHNMPMKEHYEMAKVSLNSFAEAFGVEPSNEEDFVYKSHRGRQATLRLEERGIVITYKALLVDQIQYQIVVVQAEDGDQATKEKFLKSFKLLK